MLLLQTAKRLETILRLDCVLPLFQSRLMNQLDRAPKAQTSSGDTASHLPAAFVARGIQRLFARNDIWCLAEVPLKNGRRADLMGVDAKGLVVIVEIKVARADLLSDAKWTDYLDHCDRFFWGLPPGLDRDPLAGEAFLPDQCGIIVADEYDAEIVRPAPLSKIATIRRKGEVERLARIAMRRHHRLLDPEFASATIAE